MPDSIVANLANKQRLAILNREEAVMKEMAKRWQELDASMQAEIMRVVDEFARRGEPLTEAAILRNERFTRLLWQVRAEYAKYGDFVEERVSTAQQDNLQTGINDGFDILKSTRKEFGLSIRFDRLNVEAIEMIIGQTADGTPLKRLFMNSYPQTANRIISALIEGTSKGLGVRGTADLISREMGNDLTRALLIARTEQLRAYRLGELEQYKSTGVVTEYKRLAKKDDKTCLGCLFADGEIYSTQEEFHEHPNGRCVLIPVVNGNAPTWTDGKTWFAALPPERQQRIMGDKRFELYQNGTPLENFSTLKPNATWGGAFVPTPLKDLGNPG